MYLIFPTPIGRRALLRTALTSPQLFASPVTRRKFIGSRPTLMTSFKALTRSSRIVMSITLGAEMNELLFAARASFDHHLLPRSVRPSRAVAFHLAFIRHINYSLLVLPPYWKQTDACFLLVVSSYEL